MTAWMDLEGIMLSEKGLIKKDKYTISISGLKNKQTKNPNSQQAHRHREETGGF